MDDETIAELRKSWIDRSVRVRTAHGPYKRFDSLVGTVKAVNWSGRCLVQFENDKDIGWYDIPPSELTPLTNDAAAES